MTVREQLSEDLGDFTTASAVWGYFLGAVLLNVLVWLFGWVALMYTVWTWIR